MKLRTMLKVLLSAAAGSLLLLLILMLGVKLALDRAPRYQAEIKDWVHERTGFHIAFANIWPAFRWYGPELYFDRLELRSKDDQRVLARAAGGRVGVDFWHLLHGGKIFALRVELDSPNLSVVRIAPDTFAIASEIVLGGEDSSFLELTLNDLPSGTLAIRRGFVTLQDWNPALPKLELRGVNLNLRRANELLAAQVSAELPPVLGGTFKFNGTAHGSGQIPSLDWSGEASSRDMSFPGWRALLPEYLTRLEGGMGGFLARVQGQGKNVGHAELDFGARDVVAKLGAAAAAKFESIAGDLSMTHTGDRWAVQGRRMRAYSQGRHDPDSEIDVSWRGSDTGILELNAGASYLRAETLLPLADLLPQKDLRARLREVAPTGEWTDMRVQLARKAVGDPWQLQCKAQFRGVGFEPVGGAPGLRGLSGALAGDQNSGHIRIDSQNSAFNWPRQFPQPIELNRLKTTLSWKRTPDALVVETPSLEMSTRGVTVLTKVAWQQPGDGSSPILNLTGTIDGGNVVDAHLFFPRDNLPAPTLAWLNRAFIAGRLTHADLTFQGAVQRFPFRDGGGLFLIRALIEGLTLDYQEGWPRIENLTAQAEFRNEGMSARISSGRTTGLTLDSADARFADFRNAELQVQVALHGDVGEALQFLRASPLDALAERAFSGVEGRGALKATVNLDFPFKEFDRRRTLVHVNLDGATLNRTGETVAASELTGEADIDGSQVARADLKGRILGGAFQMTARAPHNRPVTRTVLDFRGAFSADALRTALSLPQSLPLSGDADWHGVLKMVPDPAHERSLHVVSTLAGLDMRLPAPLRKPAGESVPLSVDTLWLPSGITQVRMGVGSVVRVALNLSADANGSKLDRAAVSFGTADPEFSESQLINVGGQVGQLDLAGWLKLGMGGSGGKPLETYLRTAKLGVSQLDYLGFSFHDVSLDLSAKGGGWRIAVGGPESEGLITLPPAAEASAPWTLEFTRLKCLDAGPQSAPVVDAVRETDPRSVPAINFHVAQLMWDDRSFGDVQATLVKLDDGVGLTHLRSSSPSFAVDAKGDWRGKDGGKGHVDGTISSTDVAATLKQLGFADVIEAKTGRLGFDMNWLGAPTGAALQMATGHVQIALERGQIVGLKPGAGRVLGLASVAELPRRLSLDFSDLTDKGFAFDTIRGDFDLRDGSAYTDNVLVKGPAAEIGLIGRVGLKARDYDQTAVVTGSVSTSPLPFAAFAGGPVIGAAVVLFAQVFKQPLNGLARGYYRITGSWDNPTVERIKSADAAAPAEAPK